VVMVEPCETGADAVWRPSPQLAPCGAAILKGSAELVRLIMGMCHGTSIACNVPSQQHLSHMY
jgi:hypothetical protein